jgi:hypothetical protein
MSRPPFTRPLPDPVRDRTVYVTDQVYTLKRTPPDHVRGLVKGARVRLITGVGDIPGAHPDHDWRTICPARSKVAQFYGVMASDLRKARNGSIRRVAVTA